MQVTTFIKGKRETVTIPVTPELQKALDALKDFNWCKCEERHNNVITHPRGHSVDVQCCNCLGWIQIG